MDFHLIAYYIGINLLFGTSIHYLLLPDDIEFIRLEAFINLIGICLVAYYFINKERTIKNRNNNDSHLISYYIGIIINTFTSFKFLLYPNSNNIRAYALFSFIGNCLIVYYFMNSEKK
jgi:hypothetical protein